MSKSKITKVTKTENSNNSSDELLQVMELLRTLKKNINEAEYECGRLCKESGKTPEEITENLKEIAEGSENDLELIEEMTKGNQVEVLIETQKIPKEDYATLGSAKFKKGIFNFLGKKSMEAMQLFSQHLREVSPSISARNITAYRNAWFKDYEKNNKPEKPTKKKSKTLEAMEELKKEVDELKAKNAELEQMAIEAPSTPPTPITLEPGVLSSDRSVLALQRRLAASEFDFVLELFNTTWEDLQGEDKFRTVVRRAHRKYHPDLNSDPLAHEQFDCITVAEEQVRLRLRAYNLQSEIFQNFADSGLRTPEDHPDFDHNQATTETQEV